MIHIWGRFLVHGCKIISPGVFLYFLKLLFFKICLSNFLKYLFFKFINNCLKKFWGMSHLHMCMIFNVNRFLNKYQLWRFFISLRFVIRLQFVDTLFIFRLGLMSQCTVWLLLFFSTQDEGWKSNIVYSSFA